MQPWHDADHSPPFSAVVKNGGAIPPFVFMAWCLLNYGTTLLPSLPRIKWLTLDSMVIQQLLNFWVLFLKTTSIKLQHIHQSPYFNSLWVWLTLIILTNSTFIWAQTPKVNAKHVHVHLTNFHRYYYNCQVLPHKGFLFRKTHIWDSMFSQQWLQRLIFTNASEKCSTSINMTAEWVISTNKQLPEHVASYPRRQSHFGTHICCLSSEVRAI
jgi:hypothetical protein